MSLHVALVGYGTTAHGHARFLQQQGVVLQSAMGRLAEQTAEFAAEFGFRHHTTDLAETLAQPALDAVVICSPTDAHAEQTEQALRANKHVLVEIPLATSYAAAERLVRLAAERRRVLLVAHTHRYGRGLREVKRRIDAQQLTVQHIVARYVFRRRENVDWTGRQRSWTDNLLWHHGCHATDLCLWLLGEESPGQVEVASQVALPDRQMGIPMDLGILLRTRRDALASVHMSYNSHVKLYDYLIVGHEASLLVSDGKLLDASGAVIESAGPPGQESAGLAAQDGEFLSAVLDHQPINASGAAVLPAMWALQQVQDAFEAWRPAGAIHPFPEA